MAHYFFDSRDGDRDTDESGLELASDQEAIREAIRYAGSMIRDQPDIMFRKDEFVVTVRSANTPAIARVWVRLEHP